MDHCTLDRCVCPTCGVTEILLRAELTANHKVRDFDARRITVRANDFAGGETPYVAAVRVDSKEVYRIMQRPDEVLNKEVLEDLVKALRRPM